MELLNKSASSVVDFVSKHRIVLAFIGSHAVTGYAYLYSVSDGKPLSYVIKRLTSAAVGMIPDSVVDQQMASIKKQIEKDVVGEPVEGDEYVEVLPNEGWTEEKLRSTLARYSERDEKEWTVGKISGAIYHGGVRSKGTEAEASPIVGPALSKLMAEAFTHFALSNPLHPTLFPSVRKMESEVVSMCLDLFHGDKASAGGTMTSGGTESILMAMKAYREKGRTEKGITQPEIVAPVTAHAAFDKACDYFGIKLKHIPVDPKTFKASVSAIKSAVTSNTIAIIASAPCYSNGVIDPVEEIGAFAEQRNIPLHVDCCLGSFLIAFSDAAGYKLAPFDFRVKGVTSISADTHKYGFAPKGSSVIMYSKKTDRKYQYFCAPRWTGGVYASPSIAGSRPGAVIAACWTTMVYLGKEGYTATARAILKAAKDMADGVRDIDDLMLFGEPDLSVVCFSTKPTSKVSIYGVNDEMSKKGWHLNCLQYPTCLHICTTYANANRAAAFVEDLKASVAIVAGAPQGKYAKSGSAAIYGTAASVPEEFVARSTHSFLDALYITRLHDSTPPQSSNSSSSSSSSSSSA